jgi:CRP-like cAMP-binding protein
MSLYSNILNPAPEAEVFIQDLPLFASLTGEQRAQVAAHLQRRSFAPGVILFHQDMPGLTLYMVEAGWVRIFSLGRTGQELTLGICGAREVFGELSILDAKHHSATAVTLTNATIWLLPRSHLEDLLARFPAISRAMMQILVRRIRATINHAEAMTFQDVQGRLAYEILTLAERYGRRVGQAIEVDIPLTQGDLATMVGATRESVNKALAALRSQELVKMANSNLVVLDLDGLRCIIQERGR